MIIIIMINISDIQPHPRACWAPRVTRAPPAPEARRETEEMLGLPDLKDWLDRRDNLVVTDCPDPRVLQLPCLCSPSLTSSLTWPGAEEMFSKRTPGAPGHHSPGWARPAQAGGRKEFRDRR